MRRKQTKRSVKKSIRFTESTNALVQEFRELFSSRLRLNDEEMVSWGMVAERAIQLYLEGAGNDEASLKAELDYYRTHSYMKGSPKDKAAPTT